MLREENLALYSSRTYSKAMTHFDTHTFHRIRYCSTKEMENPCFQALGFGLYNLSYGDMEISCFSVTVLLIYRKMCKV